MSRLLLEDVAGVLRGLQSIISATAKLEENQCRRVWENSSVKEIAEEISSAVGKTIIRTLTQPEAQGHITNTVVEALERSSMVAEGVKAYVKYSGDFDYIKEPLSLEEEINELNLYSHLVPDTDAKHSADVTFPLPQSAKPTDVDREILSTMGDAVTVPVASDRDGPQLGAHVGFDPKQRRVEQPPFRVRQSLSTAAKQRKVPSSRIGRMVSFGSLAAGLGVGTVAEVTRRALGLKDSTPTVGSALDSVFLSQANAERIVNTLCKVRGAALKIGQVLSIQDSTIISPGLQKAFERVRQAADFMPSWQVEKVLRTELGVDWRSKVASFEEKPFAAASIGQVHLATLPGGQEVAMKIQYPGVAKGIESDINNLVGVLKVWNVFPEGFFINNLVEVAKRELAWEVDYKREAECTKRFRKLLEPYPEYLVPRVIDELSTQQIFTTELVEGIPADKVSDHDYYTRHNICRLIMQLCIRELFEFRYMQTDPNWSNFLYNPDTQQLALLDFGASRSYSKEFMDQYIRIVKGAANGERDTVLSISRDIGFLTGYESKVMEEAHVDAVMILGEVFRSTEPFDFGGQNTTKQIQGLVPTMLKHRLCPPPEEIYSLHRKLSGVFLLCAKLNVRVDCRTMFEQAYEAYSHASYT